MFFPTFVFPIAMTSISAFVLFALTGYIHSAFGVPQVTITDAPNVLGSVLPDLNGAASASSGGCDACYIVADVAALVWYSEAFINTAATQFVDVRVGSNGTRSTRTSVVSSEAPFTYDPARISSASMQNLALTPVDYAPSATVSGAVLTSPTAYNVFSAYSITSAHLSNGRCVTTSGSAVQVNPAYSEALPSASGRVSLDAAGQQAFINHLGFSTCSGGGEHVAGGALIPVATLTASSTRTFSGASLAAVSLAASTNPSSQPSNPSPANVVTLTEVMSSTTVTATLTGTAVPGNSVSAPVIVAGSTTIKPTAQAVSLPVIAPPSGSLLHGNTTLTVGPSGTVVGTSPASGTGSYTTGNGSVPFTGEAANWKSGRVWSSLLGTCLAGVLVAVAIL